MADLTNVNITQLNNNPAPMWATETTMNALLSSSRNISKNIAELAKHSGVAEDKLQDIKDNTQISANAGNNLVRSTREGNSKLIGAIDSVREGIRSALRFDGESLSEAFNIAGGGLRKLGKSLGDDWPKWSKFLGIAGAGMMVFGELFEAISKQNKQMRELYSNGMLVENGFSGLADAAMDVGISTNELVKNMTKYSNVVVSLGTKNTTNLMKMFAETTRKGADFGMTNEESQQALLDTMDTLQNYNMLTSMTEEQRNKYTKDYLNELNELSELTGRNRDEMRKQLQAHSKTTTAFLAMARLPPELRKNFQAMQTQATGMFGKLGPRLMDEIAKYMRGGVGQMSTEFQKLFTGLGDGMGDIFAEIGQAGLTGNTEAAKVAFKKLADKLGEDSPAYADLLFMIEKMDPALAALVTGFKQSVQTSRDREIEEKKSIQAELEKRNKDKAIGDKDYMTEEKLIEERKQRAKDEKKALEDQTAAINEARATTIKLSTMFQKMISDIGPVLIPMLEGFTIALKYTLETVRDLGKWFKDLAKGWGLSNEQSNVAAVVGVAVTALLAGGLLMALVKGLTGAIVGAGSSVFSKLGGAALKGLGKVPGLKGLAKPGGAAGAAGGAANAAGGATGGILEALSGGAGKVLGAFLEALGNPKILLGAAALSLLMVSLGGAIALAGPYLKDFGEAATKIIEAGGGAIKAGLEGLGKGSREILEGLGHGLSETAKGLGEGISSVFKGVGEGLSTAAKGIGEGISLAFEGPRKVVETLGTKVVDVMDSITRMRTETIGKTTEQIEKLSQINSQNLTGAASGIEALKKALEGFTPSTTTGIDQFIGSFFATDPVEKLQKFVAVGVDLGITADNISKLSASLSGFMGINFQVDIITNLTKAINNLKIAISNIQPRMLMDFGRSLDAMLSSNANEKLQILSSLSTLVSGSAQGDLFLNIARGIDTLKTALTNFAPDLLTGFNQAFEAMLSRDNTEKLQKLVTVSNELGTAAIGIEQFRSAVAPIVGSAAAAQPPTPATPTPPVITTDQLNIKTLEYYTDSIDRLTKMLDKFDILHEDLDRIRTNDDLNMNKLMDAYRRTTNSINP